MHLEDGTEAGEPDASAKAYSASVLWMLEQDLDAAVLELQQELEDRAAEAEATAGGGGADAAARVGDAAHARGPNSDPAPSLELELPDEHVSPTDQRHMARARAGGRGNGARGCRGVQWPRRAVACARLTASPHTRWPPQTSEVTRLRAALEESQEESRRYRVQAGE